MIRTTKILLLKKRPKGKNQFKLFKPHIFTSLDFFTLYGFYSLYKNAPVFQTEALIKKALPYNNANKIPAAMAEPIEPATLAPMACIIK